MRGKPIGYMLLIVRIRYFGDEKKTGTQQLYLGSLLVTCRSAIGQFFPLSLVTVPEVYANVKSAQF